MEGLKSFHAHVKDLYERARKLTVTSLTLATLFTEEANRLKREDEASRLRGVYFSIRRDLYWAKYNETSAGHAHSQANLKFSLVTLGIKVATAVVSKNKQASAIADHVLGNLGNEELPFGTVLVCIGPKGMPDDVGVVSISQLARESNRLEPEVINRLREHGYLLLGEKDFSLLIGRLIDDVRGGRLLLPISGEKLSEIMAPSLIRLESENQL